MKSSPISGKGNPKKCPKEAKEAGLCPCTDATNRGTGYSETPQGCLQHLLAPLPSLHLAFQAVLLFPQLSSSRLPLPSSCPQITISLNHTDCQNEGSVSGYTGSPHQLNGFLRSKGFYFLGSRQRRLWILGSISHKNSLSQDLPGKWGAGHRGLVQPIRHLPCMRLTQSQSPKPLIFP